MGKSISRSQAEDLAKGLTATGGQSKDNFAPVESYTEMILLAGSLVEAAQLNLNATNSNASGSLSDSLQVGEIQSEGSAVRIPITMAFYGRFVNKGVKGVVSGIGLYSFKNLYFSRAMITSLMKSKQAAGKKITSTNTAKTISKNEQKNKSISDISSAFGAAVNIKKYGIKATGFIDKAIITTQSMIKDKLGKALKIDIMNSLTTLDNDI